ncbi:defensin-like protein 1 [Amborella trichopoda]|uniref:defensin-like protein 1 n=1 Tax=Amborella trichopoda TaxID=13333 RepID=UPI0005D463FF|nr:defensin-like protein 1 [Amborella trichopoda]|eukprot:XP_011622260.1 defensin-like protein 1 [Amborella trichopoda]
MAKLVSPKAFFVFLFVFLLISASEFSGSEAKLCQKRSRTWSGFCANSNNCSRQCKNLEGARFGACHRQRIGLACFCYFNC